MHDIELLLTFVKIQLLLGGFVVFFLGGGDEVRVILASFF